MGLDMAKYRKLFLEEASEHLSEISGALLRLEKDPASVDAIDVVFRMAHSIKSMAASLGYESISEVAHRLEDRMQGIRAEARLKSPDELALLFQGLEGLEHMVEVVRESGEPPPPPPGLLEELGRPLPPADGAALQKEPSSPADSVPPKAEAPKADAREEAEAKKKALS